MGRALNVGFNRGPATLIASTGKYGIIGSPATQLNVAGGGPPPPPGQRYSPGWFTAITGAEKTTAQGLDSGLVNLQVTIGGNLTTVQADYSQAGIPGGHAPHGGLGGYSNLQTLPGGFSKWGPCINNVAGTASIPAMIEQGYSWLELEPTQGNYQTAAMDADLATCASLGIQFMPRINFRNFNGAAPFPSYLNSISYQFSSSAGTGNDLYRWDDTLYLPSWKALNKFYCNRYDGHPNWAGMATQETSLSNPISGGTLIQRGYTIDLYFAALCAESDWITQQSPHGRHFAYHNFMPGDTKYGSANAVTDFWMDQYAAHIQGNGAWLGGPDLTSGNPGGSVASRCYPRYHPYRFGGTVTRGSGSSAQTTTFGKTGPTFCCMQPAEWKGIAPAVSQTPQQWYDYATNTNTYGTNTSLNSPLNLQGICPDLSYVYALTYSSLVPVIIAHPGPFPNNWTP